MWFETETAAIQAGAAMRQRKQRRGYRAVGGPPGQKHEAEMK